MPGVNEVEQWFHANQWEPFPFQKEAWKHVLNGCDGLVNAPTGSGKSYALLAPTLLKAHAQNSNGVKVIWITPIRALSKEIALSAQRLIKACFPSLSVAVRSGDTSTAERQKQQRAMPDLLITTPESLHLLLCRSDHPKMFSGLVAVVADEWHELMGSKRGVQIELAFAYLRTLAPKMLIWGISATIGNLSEAMEVLVGHDRAQRAVLVRSDLKKALVVKTLIPDEFERLPWSGHIGAQLVNRVCEVIHAHQTTLVFTNTRAQSEIWYRNILEYAPQLAGMIAMHHSALERDLRNWVEDALYEGKLKAVVCTSSLDLGVDFRPVEAVIQIGGPKGVARFIQRAGRSGHRPGAQSSIWFLPTNALELVEAAALRKAIEEGYVESRHPYVRSFDVLIQFMTTLAVGGGFQSEPLLAMVQQTHAFASITPEEWSSCLRFITTGGVSLEAYPEFRKVVIDEGAYRVTSNQVARNHRMSVGTIVGDTMVRVKYRRGATIGYVEEYFAAGLNEGDVFWFAGRSLEHLAIRGNELEVRNSKRKTGRIPAWQGGRLPLSSMLSDLMQRKIDDFLDGVVDDPEMERLAPLFELQMERSLLPKNDTLLVEQLSTKEGYHLFVYPFAGRLVHEGMASLVAWRIAQEYAVSFSMAFNDYGFELLSDQPLTVTTEQFRSWFSTKDLVVDLQAAVNAAELARRKFRDIAVIAGLIFRGFPGAPIKDRHLQSSSSLVFDVFNEYDNSNLLLRQAFDEMLEYQLEIMRFRKALTAIDQKSMVMTHPEKPTPLAFPIMVDRLRERMSTEQLGERIAKMQRDFQA